MTLSAIARSLRLLALMLLLPGLGRGEPLRFFAVGDVPYVAAETAQLRDLWAAATLAAPAFLVHVGDIKGGSAPCTDAGLRTIAALFGAQGLPVVYTPGDNEWTDCHRAGAGARDPLERLARLREVFFGDPSVLRLDALGPVRGDGRDALDFPENYLFEREGVLFVVLHLVGSDNGYRPEDAAAIAEQRARDAANRRLLERAAMQTRAADVRALVLIFHANPGFERTDPSVGFAGFRQALLGLLNAYGGPVLALHGDTHRFRHDRPLPDPATGLPMTRFVRVEVPGSPLVGGVWIGIEPEAAEPFRVEEVYPVSRDRLVP